jgi:hypothetical protein
LISKTVKMKTLIGYTSQVFDESDKLLGGGSIRTFRNLKLAYESGITFIHDTLHYTDYTCIKGTEHDDFDDFIREKERLRNGDDITATTFYTYHENSTHKKYYITLVGVYLLDSDDE